jgi:hypothetical protein
MVNRRFAVAVVFGLTLLSGVVHGYLDRRWSSNADVKAIGARLANLPERSGDWVVSEKSELSAGVAQMLRCYGSEVRTYRNDQTGVAVKVAVLFGPRGPIAVHTPEICYSSIGTSQTRERQVESVSTATQRHELWSVQFSRDPEPQPSLEVWYAWTDGTRWEARENPRYWWTENLYKIQVAGPISDNSQQPIGDFLQAFLPDLERIMQ